MILFPMRRRRSSRIFHASNKTKKWGRPASIEFHSRDNRLALPLCHHPHVDFIQVLQHHFNFEPANLPVSQLGCGKSVFFPNEIGLSLHEISEAENETRAVSRVRKDFLFSADSGWESGGRLLRSSLFPTRP